jgi:hypothetical protein
MALKSLKVTLQEQPAAAKKLPPQIIDVTGNTVSTFNDLKKQAADLVAQAANAEAPLKETGVVELTKINCASEYPASSVKLRDETGAMVLVTQQNRYGVLDEVLVDRTFSVINEARKQKGLPPLDINDYIQRVATLKLNSEVFLGAEDGTFREDIFRAVRRALDQAGLQLIADGKLPVGTKLYEDGQSVTVKKVFHEQRWTFGVPANRLLNETVKATVAIKSVND